MDAHSLRGLCLAAMTGIATTLSPSAVSAQQLPVADTVTLGNGSQAGSIQDLLSPLNPRPSGNAHLGVGRQDQRMMSSGVRKGPVAATKGRRNALNLICGIRATDLYKELAGTWGGDGLYAREKKRVPKGTPFWIAVEIQYGNRSGQPNLKACPKNEAMFPSPMKTSLCMAWWNVRRIGPARSTPTVPDQRDRCIQTKLIRLIGTGENIGNLAVDLSPPVRSVEACKTFTLTARVTRENLPGNQVFAPLQWVNTAPSALREVATLSQGTQGIEETRTFLAMQPGTHKVVARYLGNSPGRNSLAGTAQVRVLAVPPEKIVVRPDAPPILTVGDRIAFEAVVAYGKKHECIPSPKVGEGMTLTATGGTVEGNTFVATTPGIAKLVVRHTDPVSKLTLDRELAIRVEDRSSLVLSIKADKTRIGACDRVTYTPSISTKDGKPLSGEVIRLGLDWSLKLDATSKDSRAALIDSQAMTGANTGLSTYSLSRLGPGEHSVTAILRDAGTNPPTARAKLMVQAPTPDKFEIQPRDFKVRKGAVMSFQGTVTFKEECVGARRLEHGDMEWRADRGKFRGDGYVASEAGAVKITAGYRPGGPGSAVAIDVAQFEVIDRARKASVDASVTRKAPK